LVLCNSLSKNHSFSISLTYIDNILYFCLYLFFETKFKSTRMEKFHQTKKHHGDKKKSSSSRPKYDLTQSGRKKLPEDFLYTQNHKSIWNFFSKFLDKKFAEEDLSEILDEDEVARIKTAPTIPPMLQFQPQTPGEVESEEAKRTRTRGQSLATQEEKHSISMESIEQLC
jgi:hypothetical protein